MRFDAFCKTWKDLDAKAFSLFGQPTADLTEAGNVVAMVPYQGRHQPIGKAISFSLRQEQKAILGHRRVKKDAVILPIRKKLIHRNGIDDCSRQDMGADLRSLLHDPYCHVMTAPCRELPELNASRKACWASADDGDVELHYFASHKRHFQMSVE